MKAKILLFALLVTGNVVLNAQTFVGLTIPKTAVNPGNNIFAPVAINTNHNTTSKGSKQTLPGVAKNDSLSNVNGATKLTLIGSDLNGNLNSKTAFVIPVAVKNDSVPSTEDSSTTTAPPTDASGYHDPRVPILIASPKLFPNPVETTFTIVLDYDYQAYAIVMHIYSLESNTDAGLTNDNMQKGTNIVDVSSLPAGRYNVNIHSFGKQNFYSNQIIIKQ